jgi:CDGSH-type Zn-finger protein
MAPKAKDPTVSCAPNGPYIVRDLDALIGVDGAELPTKPTMALCRCGASSNKPFCDGTHARIDFDDAKHPERVPDRRDDYEGRRITIHDNRGICAHAGHCTDNLAQVFRMGVEPWIDAEGAEAERIVEVIETCPSGALSYSIDGVEHRDLDRPPALRVTPDGPYRLQGGLALEGVVPLEGTSEEHRTLCRCGHSKNKPFCDGSHWHAGFRDGPSPAAQGAKDDGGDRAPPDAAATGPAGGSQISAGSPEEPHNGLIQHLARFGLSEMGHHGPMAAMGVPRYELPSWDDLQVLTAQLHRLPQLDDVSVSTELVIGPRAGKPLRLEIPLFVSDMSFGALSEEAKLALARGAELAGTGICSGEGGMLPEEQQACSRYFYELASARFGFSFEQLQRVQAFHFKGGQGAKTGTGGHLPGHKVTEKIARVRGLDPGQDAISPARFVDWNGMRRTSTRRWPWVSTTSFSTAEAAAPGPLR